MNNFHGPCGKLITNHKVHKEFTKDTKKFNMLTTIST